MFALSIDLHEDHEAGGFYLYETGVGPPAGVCRTVTEALRAAGFPLRTAGAGLRVGPPWKRPASQARGLGAVVVDAPRETPFFEGRLPVGLVLVRRAVPVP